MKQYPPSLLKGSQVMMLALACGVIVANLYYAQPLLGLIRADIGLSAGAAGLIVTLTQIGYGVGLLLIVPLGDLVENKRLVVTALLASAVALVGLSSVHDASSFLLGAWLLGLSCVSAQVLVPYAAHLSPPEKRGEMVGRVMSGLLLGSLFSPGFWLSLSGGLASLGQMARGAHFLSHSLWAAWIALALAWLGLWVAQRLKGLWARKALTPLPSVKRLGD